ncbi:MAG: hypothetical protein HY075_03300 [Deltaproteobacteria bacterium]|nr:hypothetical protein [Deltaproteobacteria bacterium]
MNRHFGMAHAIISVAAVAVAFTGCNPVGEFRDLVQGGTEALSKEDAAYRSLKNVAPTRSEGAINALREWSGSIANLRAVMKTANEKLQGSKESKIRASKDVQSALDRFKSGVDTVLGRNYAEASLQLVAPWRLGEAQQIAAGIPNAMREISSYYQVVFQATNPNAGKSYEINVRQDEQILDTYQGCVDRVAAVTKSQGKSEYCVSAARAACGHQINLGCVTDQVRNQLVGNICPDVKTETVLIAAGDSFRPESRIGANEELKEWKYGSYVKEANPDRNVSTFCQGDYDASTEVVGSRSGYSCSAYSGKGLVRIYGYDENRHVHVEIEGVHNQFDARKDVRMGIYVDGRYVGERVIQPDFGWVNNVYALDVTERAFQVGSRLKLQFREHVPVTMSREDGTQFTKNVHWEVDVEIRGEDVPFIRKREVHVTKYTPNSWVGGIVNSCVSQTPVLK